MDVLRTRAYIPQTIHLQRSGYVPDQTEWERKAANLLKAELKRQGVTYAQLAERIGDKDANVRNKLSRGKFSAAFLLQSLEAIGRQSLDLR